MAVEKHYAKLISSRFKPQVSISKGERVSNQLLAGQ